MIVVDCVMIVFLSVMIMFFVYGIRCGICHDLKDILFLGFTILLMVIQLVSISSKYL